MMGFYDLIARSCKKYLFNCEFLISFIFALIIINYIFNFEYFWYCIDRVRVYYALGTFSSRCNEVPQSLEQGNGKLSAFWELKKDRVGVFAIQGRRAHMEDRFNAINDFSKTKTSIYGIFDGHGGEFAAEFTEKMVFKSVMTRVLMTEHREAHLDISHMLQDEFLKVDEKLLQQQTSSQDDSGTTGLVAVLQNDTLTVANVGDSRGVLCDADDNAIPLSFDHKPNNQKERKRIKNAGGFIRFSGVWRVAGILATSRAFGDPILKENNFIVAEPDVLTFDVRPGKARFFVLATDGLWDVMSNAEVVNFVKNRLQESDYGAKSLVLQAYCKGSLDNITVLVVNLEARAQQESGAGDAHVEKSNKGVPVSGSRQPAAMPHSSSQVLASLQSLMSDLTHSSHDFHGLPLPLQPGTSMSMTEMGLVTRIFHQPESNVISLTFDH